VPEAFGVVTKCDRASLVKTGKSCRGVDLLLKRWKLISGKAGSGLHWDERLSLVLAEDLRLRRLKFAGRVISETTS
jgi:DNA recombination-dependent growth factor C